MVSLDHFNTLSVCYETKKVENHWPKETTYMIFSHAFEIFLQHLKYIFSCVTLPIDFSMFCGALWQNDVSIYCAISTTFHDLVLFHPLSRLQFFFSPTKACIALMYKLFHIDQDICTAIVNWDHWCIYLSTQRFFPHVYLTPMNLKPFTCRTTPIYIFGGGLESFHHCNHSLFSLTWTFSIFLK